MSDQQPYGHQPGWSQQQGQQPYQGQQYGPPGEQPPYPGPGYGSPPRLAQPGRSNSHWVRKILVGIGAVVVVWLILSRISSGGVSTVASGDSATTTGATSPAASHQEAARVGSYFDVQDTSGDTYRVTLVKVIDPAQGADQFTTPDTGKRFVGAAFMIKALHGSPQDEDANNDAVLIGSNGQDYTADFSNIAGYTNFEDGAIHVAQGDRAEGAVTFQVPDHVKVVAVQWGPASNFGSAIQWDTSK